VRRARRPARGKAATAPRLKPLFAPSVPAAGLRRGTRGREADRKRCRGGPGPDHLRPVPAGALAAPLRGTAQRARLAHEGVDNQGEQAARGSRWENASLRKLLTNPIYLGKVTYRGATYEGHPCGLDSLAGRRARLLAEAPGARAQLHVRVSAAIAEWLAAKHGFIRVAIDDVALSQSPDPRVRALVAMWQAGNASGVVSDLQANNADTVVDWPYTTWQARARCSTRLAQGVEVRTREFGHDTCTSAAHSFSSPQPS